MAFFKDLTEDVDGFNDFKKKQFDDDEKTKKYLDNLEHKEFISALLNLGTLIETISIYMGFIEDQINETIKNTSTQSRNRKMNKFIKDLNIKINLEYDFDETTVIVEDCVLFEGEVFIFFSKSQFLKVKKLQDM